jgi:signal transduction histidine kinase
MSFATLWRWFLLGNLGLALAWLVINFGLSWQWVSQPFAGFLHQNRVVTKSNLPGWETRELTIREIKLNEDDVILTVNGMTVFSSEEVTQYIRQQEVGQSIDYLLQSPTGRLDSATLAVVNFTGQDFLQLVVIPTFFALLGLIAAAVAIYTHPDFLQVRLFGLFSVGLVYALVSLPDFAVGWLFPLTFFGALIGKLALPPLFLHFLLLFPHPRRVLKDWPALLPLIYMPLLPALIYLPTLFNRPEVTGYFTQFISGYTLMYAMVWVGLLWEATLQTENLLARKQARTLLIGLILPTFLAMSLNLLLDYSLNRQLIFETVERYGLIGLPIAVTVATIHYQMFELKRGQPLHKLYLAAIGAALMGYFLLLALINATTMHLDFIRVSDLNIILLTVVAYFLLRPVYWAIRHRLEQRLYGSVEDFRTALRIFLRDLLKVKSRHDLESLVSWNIPQDFKLRSAELTLGSRPNSPYSLRLFLTVNNVSLGTLFLGAKINGGVFTEREQKILAELQRQISLALWSLELDEAIRTTEELTRLKSKFVANVSHELRTPLNIIINSIGFVIDGDVGPLNPEQGDYLNQALQGAEQLLQIINNILDMSKLEVGQMTLQLGPVNLADLIAETIPRVQQTLNHKPIQLLTDLSPNLPEVEGDRLRLRQIILNLLSNAAKFTETGTIRLRAYPENSRVIIQVADTGQGIAETMLPALFQQFPREGLTDRAGYAGAGLSLPLTKSLVELHGGRIQVESRLGRGTTFMVTLPVKQNTEVL